MRTFEVGDIVTISPRVTWLDLRDGSSLANRRAEVVWKRGEKGRERYPYRISTLDGALCDHPVTEHEIWLA